MPQVLVGFVILIFALTALQFLCGAIARMGKSMFGSGGGRPPVTVTYEPVGVPVQLAFDLARGELRVNAGRKVVTPLGAFAFGAGAEPRRTLTVVRASRRAPSRSTGRSTSICRAICATGRA